MIRGAVETLVAFPLWVLPVTVDMLRKRVGDGRVAFPLWVLLVGDARTGESRLHAGCISLMGSSTSPASTSARGNDLRCISLMGSSKS